jgi:ABC-type hemin transport system ATPase subunit
VLVKEAVNLGIAIYNMRQGEGTRYETLFQDEKMGALDGVNAKEYLRMLRRGVNSGGFRQVIPICDAPLVGEFADRVLSVGAGRVVVGNPREVVTDFPDQWHPFKGLANANLSPRMCADGVQRRREIG